MEVVVSGADAGGARGAPIEATAQPDDSVHDGGMDHEVRDAVMQLLEESGVLTRIKAELRTRVFQAFFKSEDLKKRKASKAVQFAATENGLLALSLVRDLLQELNLNFALSVFEAETSDLPHAYYSRNDIAALKRIKDCPGEPIILSLLRCSNAEEHECRQKLDTQPAPQLKDQNVKNFFAQQPFFVELDKNAAPVSSDIINDDTILNFISNNNNSYNKNNNTSKEDKPSISQTDGNAKATGSATLCMGQEYCTEINEDSKDFPLSALDKKNTAITVKPSHSQSPYEAFDEDLSLKRSSCLKPLPALSEKAALSGTTNLPSLKRLPPVVDKDKHGANQQRENTVKVVSRVGNDAEAFESLGDELLTSLGSDSVTTEESVSALDTPGLNYIESFDCSSVIKL